MVTANLYCKILNSFYISPYMVDLITVKYTILTLLLGVIFLQNLNVLMRKSFTNQLAAVRATVLFWNGMLCHWVAMPQLWEILSSASEYKPFQACSNLWVFVSPYYFLVAYVFMSFENQQFHNSHADCWVSWLHLLVGCHVIATTIQLVTLHLMLTSRSVQHNRQFQ